MASLCLTWRVIGYAPFGGPSTVRSKSCLVVGQGTTPQIIKFRQCGPPIGLRPALFQPLCRLQNLVDMARHLHLAPEPTNNTLAVDQEGRALDAHVRLAVHALLRPDAIGFADLAVLVGSKGEGKLVLRLEFVMALPFFAPDPHPP